MAAAIHNSRVNAGKKMKCSLKKKKMMRMVARTIASELEEEVKTASDSEGAIGSCESEMDQLSDDEAIEADHEDNVELCDKENAAESSAGANTGWADAMAKILNKKTPKSKPTILIKNKELEKEKEKLKQERLEKRKQVCPVGCLIDDVVCNLVLICSILFLAGFVCLTF
jgi:hypothetical protein